MGVEPKSQVREPHLEAPMGRDEASVARAAVVAFERELEVACARRRAAGERVENTLAQLLGSLAGGARLEAARVVAERYPELAEELREFGAQGAKESAPVPEPAAPEEPRAAEGTPSEESGLPPLHGQGASQATALEEQRAVVDAPGTRAPELEQADVAERSAEEALETFCGAFVELCRGYEEFGRELGLRTLAGEGGVSQARDGRELCSYLLQAGASGQAELQRVFEELKVHQLALVKGVGAGGRALVERLSPEAIHAAAGGVWPLQGARRWMELEARYQELAGEKNGVSEVLFGREFARAYTGVMDAGVSEGRSVLAQGDGREAGPVEKVEREPSQAAVVPRCAPRQAPQVQAAEAGQEAPTTGFALSIEAI